VRETLKVVTDAKQAMTGWNHPFFTISAQTLTDVMRSIVQEAKQWIERSVTIVIVLFIDIQCSIIVLLIKFD
jgi:hypothetical protein